jgi:soluble lytic murein transglycosylase-like protein
MSRQLIVLPSGSMRAAILTLATLLVASAMNAQVTLTIDKNGNKVITNIGANGSSGRGSDFTWLAKQRNRKTRFDAIIDKYAVQYGVDPVLVRAVIQVESDFNPNCVSNKGARGLMQLMPETAKRYGVAKMHDPEENIRGGVRYLADLLEMFRNDLPRVLAAYNAGENAVLRYAGIPPYSETTTYVNRALTVYYGAPYGQATSFAGHRGGRKLAGGFTATVTQPLVSTLMPGLRYLGSR